jgi:hypothetical protein
VTPPNVDPHEWAARVVALDRIARRLDTCSTHELRELVRATPALNGFDVRDLRRALSAARDLVAQEKTA